MSPFVLFSKILLPWYAQSQKVRGKKKKKKKKRKERKRNLQQMLLCGIKSIKADENFIWLVLWLQYSLYFFLFLQKCLCHITFFLNSVLVLLLPSRKRVRVFFSCIHKKRQSIFYTWFFPAVAICFSNCILLVLCPSVFPFSTSRYFLLLLPRQSGLFCTQRRYTVALATEL